MSYRHLAVIAANFAFSFPVKMLGFIRGNLQSGQNLVHYSTLIKPEIEHRRFQTVLEMPPPIALIGLAIRPEASFVEAYRRAHIPMVLIDEEMDGASTIATDNFRGGFIAGEYLAKIGRKNIAVVCGNTHVSGGYNAVNRLNGLKAALAAKGLTVDEHDIVEVIDYSYHEGVEAMKKWLAEKRKIDAIFSAAGDDCATGLLRVAQENGIRVPTDIAIIGYDDIDTAKFATPALTTIRQPLQEMANAAYNLASTADNDAAEHPKKISFAPELIVRAST